jgi:hypothetical protein
MISDVLFDAVADIDGHLKNPTFDKCYQGKLRETIIAVRNEMDRVRSLLDEPPGWPNTTTDNPEMFKRSPHAYPLDARHRFEEMAKAKGYTVQYSSHGAGRYSLQIFGDRTGKLLVDKTYQNDEPDWNKLAIILLTPIRL